jgi:bacterioferritin
MLCKLNDRGGSTLKSNKNEAIEVLDIKKIRKMAREELGHGAVTKSIESNRGTIIGLLQGSLATELVCSLRYRQNAIIAEDLGAEIVATEFWEHAGQEQAHADKIAKRIALLEGTPEYNPDNLTKKSHADYTEFSTNDDDVLRAMLRENLVAERVAVETYREIIKFIGDKDPTTRRLFEAILEEEEEHADELNALLNAVSNYTKHETESHATSY